MLLETFDRLDALLYEHRQWWQFQPFHSIESRWQTLAPSLHSALEALSSRELHALTADSEQRRRFLEPWLPIAGELHGLCKLPRLQGRHLAFERRLEHGINGRKWAQISAFAALLPGQQAVVEWCSGKGHLGRVLRASGAAQVDSLEREPALCAAGEKLAARAGLPMTFHRCDVINDPTDRLLATNSHAVALHACGQLHMHLLKQVVARGSEAVSVVPCCYYLIPDDAYVPLSRAAASSDLRLHKPDLHIPLRETVTGGARATRLRSQELRWRLAFDCLQRHLREDDSYLPLPTIPRQILGGSFETFIVWAIDRKGLSPTGPYRADDFLQLAEARLPAIQQMELVQQLFQRPLEMWLALDRALYLQEHGYLVRMGEFCARHLTPRNIFIQGRLSESA